MLYILLLLAALGIGAVLVYNGLINKRNQVENAFGGVDVQLRKRYDLIPNLVSSVQQYMTHERSTLEELTRLRTEALQGDLPADERVKLDNQITKRLGGIMVAVEAYPDLKASGNFQQLQRSLNEVESQISAARRAYNAAVTDYNTAIESVPGNLFAGPMTLTRKEVFEIPEAQRENVDVAQLFDRSGPGQGAAPAADGAVTPDRQG